MRGSKKRLLPRSLNGVIRHCLGECSRRTGMNCSLLYWTKALKGEIRRGRKSGGDYGAHLSLRSWSLFSRTRTSEKGAGEVEEKEKRRVYR